jgi:hypothetical protein
MGRYCGQAPKAVNSSYDRFSEHMATFAYTHKSAPKGMEIVKTSRLAQMQAKIFPVIERPEDVENESNTDVSNNVNATPHGTDTASVE